MRQREASTEPVTTLESGFIAVLSLHRYLALYCLEPGIYMEGVGWGGGGG